MKRYNLYFILSLIVFLALNVFLAIYNEIYLYGVNTGTVAFITIAQKYIRGDFSNVIVGGFMPLSSWLLIPFLKLGIAPMASLSIVKLIVGLLILIGVRLLSYRFDISGNIRNIISFTAVPIVLQFTLTEHIPDLLIVCAVTYYLSIIFSTDYPDKQYKGILCGIVGAIGYFGKAFIFPFFILHFILLNILHYLRIKEKKIWRNAILGLIVFFIISGPWIFAVSNKYGKIMFDVSGTYNHRIIGPEIPRSTQFHGWEGWQNFVRMGHPVYEQGFFPPPNETAISIWEDFVLLTPYLKPWSPFDSWDSFRYQIKLIAKNIYYILGIFENYFSFFSVIIILGYILLYILPLNSQVLRNSKLYPLITMIIYCGGYTLVYPTYRYLWVNSILLLLMGLHLLSILFRSDFFSNTRKHILIAAFSLSFIIVPLRDSIGMQNRDKVYGILAEKLQKHNELRNKKIASNDKFSETLKILFYSDMNVKYYGQARKNISDEELRGELEKYDIDFYVVWDDSATNETPQFILNHREIRGGIPIGNEKMRFKIYALK